MWIVQLKDVIFCSLSKVSPLSPTPNNRQKHWILSPEKRNEEEWHLCRCWRLPEPLQLPWTLYAWPLECVGPLHWPFVFPSIYLLVLMKFFPMEKGINIPASWCFNLFSKRFFLAISDMNWPLSIRSTWSGCPHLHLFWDIEIFCNDTD